MTAEFAAVVPAVLLVLAVSLGAIHAVGQQLRLTDAAAQAARALSRGEDTERATGLVHHAVGDASVAIERRGDFVCVRLDAPSAVLAAFGLVVTAGSCALAGGV